jgi:hypothetical protein
LPTRPPSGHSLDFLTYIILYRMILHKSIVCGTILLQTI